MASDIKNALTTAAAAVLVFSGALAVAGSLRDGAAPAQASTPGPAASASAAPPPVFTEVAQTLPRSIPETLSIPSIGLKDAPIAPVGLNPDQTVEVPPLDRPELVGWYRHRPTPGEPGPAVLLGHVDAHGKPAVFHRAHTLKPGATITVERADGTSADFTVDSLERVDKDAFPTEKVYGATDSAVLRLITCGGAFDPATGHYEDNVIVYAHLAE
ncbi:class F sortase [Nonomuraea sp. NN258]|uniref:class F sortase n=1 Tax=Nonomuraea antri TaxID=2730852 RepID=UPI001569C582|nr:class F sortase [Nonomuraea antri]NRQ39258.1 class F sortase [Nonomuraea antri]